MSFDISHRIPLRMHLQTLRMHRCTVSHDLCMGRGNFFPRISNCWPQYTYSLSNLCGCMIKINWVIPKIVCGRVLRPHCYLRMHKITSALNEMVNLLPWLFSATTVSYWGFQILVIWQHLGRFLLFSHIFTVHAQKYVLMSFRWKFWHWNSTPWPQFPYKEWYMAIWRRSLLVFAFNMLNVQLSTIHLLPVYSTYCPRKSVSCFSPRSKNFHQVWSWYDRLLAGYSVLAADTLRDLFWPWSLTFWPWSVVIHGGSHGQPLH